MVLYYEIHPILQRTIGNMQIHMLSRSQMESQKLGESSTLNTKKLSQKYMNTAKLQSSTLNTEKLSQRNAVIFYYIFSFIFSLYASVYSGVARILFRGGGRPGHLKAITRPPQGVQEAKAPPDGSGVSFFQTMPSIRK